MQRSGGDDGERRWSSCAGRRAGSGRDGDAQSSGGEAADLDQLFDRLAKFDVTWRVDDLKLLQAPSQPLKVAIKENWPRIANGKSVEDPITELKAVICSQRDRY